jgi:hypothetical protein
MFISCPNILDCLVVCLIIDHDLVVVLEMRRSSEGSSDP